MTKRCYSLSFFKAQNAKTKISRYFILLKHWAILELLSHSFQLKLHHSLKHIHALTHTHSHTLSQILGPNAKGQTGNLSIFACVMQKLLRKQKKFHCQKNLQHFKLLWFFFSIPIFFWNIDEVAAAAKSPPGGKIKSGVGKNSPWSWKTFTNLKPSLASCHVLHNTQRQGESVSISEQLTNERTHLSRPWDD